MVGYTWAEGRERDVHRQKGGGGGMRLGRRGGVGGGGACTILPGQVRSHLGRRRAAAAASDTAE